MNMNMNNGVNPMPNMTNYAWNQTASFPYASNPYNFKQQPMYQSSNLNQQQQQQFYQNNIIWVKGKENARSMQIPPNSTVILLDSQVGKFYIKTTDDIGLGRLRIFSYTEEPDVESNPSSSTSSTFDLSNYVTKNELQEAIKEIKKNEQFISGSKFSANQSTSTKKQQYKTINKQF